MPIARRLFVVAAGAVMAVAVAVTAHAQGHGNGNANGHKSQPPSSSALLSPASTTSASPLS
ncbi:MAG TPA: hypothetical protein VFI56_28010, partial [Vicinamibacterales bacterium]|nr:hypothetical protein [Vicinamibacterales bacterium]